MKVGKVGLVIVWLVVIAACWGVIMASEYLGTGKFNKTVPWSVAIVLLLIAGGLILTYRVKRQE